jgi:hypothetical protein
MRNKVFLLASIFLLTFGVVTNGVSQTNPWTKAWFNFWGIRCLASHESLLFAGSSSGTLRSTDNGLSWTVPDSLLGPSNVTSIAIHDSAIIAIGTGGEYRSFDSGRTWTNISSTIFGPLIVCGSVIVSGTHGGLFSSDDGATWQASAQPVVGSVNCMAISDSFLFAATDSGIFRSSNNGLTWTSVPGRWLQVNSLVASGNNIFVASLNPPVSFNSQRRIFRSTDEGSNWTVVDSSGYNQLAISGSNVFAGYNSSDGFEVSSDNGTHWFSSFADAWDRFAAIIVSGSNVIVGTNNTGIYVSQISKIFGSLDVSRPTDSESANALRVYPNPTTGLLHIESTSNDIVITDLLGRTRMRVLAGDGVIDVSRLPQGVYSISEGRSRAKFVKE